MNRIEKLDILAGSCPRITTVVHTHPDGDAVGSGIALTCYLQQKRGKDAVLILPDRMQDSLSFLSDGLPAGSVIVFEDEERKAAERIAGSDLVFCLDCRSFSRTAGMEELLRESGAEKVLIDHHLSPEEEAFGLVFSRTSVSSTCELLYGILLGMSDISGDPSRLPKLTADALLAGMTTDTNNFANSVWPGTFEMASSLVASGVDRDGILEKIYNRSRENRVRLMGFLLSEKLRFTPQGAAYIILDKETQERFDKQEGETEGFVNIPLTVSSVRMSIFLTEEDDRYRVSVRSKKGTSANLFASAHFNGGGHEQASGGKLLIGKDIPSAGSAEAYVLDAIEKFFRQ